MPETTISAQEAADALGVSVATIYSYVSRGLIRSEPDDESRRTHRYSLADVQRLQARQQARREPERRAEGALHWGVPVIESRVTLIEDGHLYYRGWDALLLAQRAVRFEDVVALLWEADRDALREMRLAVDTPPFPDLPPLEHMQAILLRAAQTDPAALNLKPDGVRATGWRLLHVLVASVAGQAPQQAPIAARLGRAWGYDQDPIFDLLDDALILCADHELNVSAFTARAVASAQASPYQVVVAGLAALSGAKHGGAAQRVGALFDEVDQPERAPAVMQARLRRGETVPGFGHRLYPQGDPRARFLFDQTAAVFAKHPAIDLAKAAEAAGAAAVGDAITLDFALTTLARALGRPEAAIVLFALGRTAGWMAHAMEGYAGPMIRPRARYVGDLPQGDPHNNSVI